MLRIYLDQNKWIDLARAATGHPRGEPFVDALAMCRAGVEAGDVSFPLDMYRYWETSKRRDDRSRNDVADVMTDLSRKHTMSEPSGVLDHELDLALRRRFGRPTEIRSRQVFGIGMAHIADGRIDWPGLDLGAPPDGGAALPAGARSLLDEQFRDLLEELLLRSGPEAFRAAGFDPASADHGERFVNFENTIATAIADQGLTGDLVDLAVRFADLGDIRPPVEVALERIKMTFDEFIVQSH